MNKKYNKVNNNINNKYNMYYMKIIILIIATDNLDSYITLQNTWRKYMNNHEHIKCFFIKMDPNIDSDVFYDETKDKNTIYVKGKESIAPGILQKTVKSIEYVLQNYEFDYLLRTNLSSVVDLDMLYDRYANNENKVEYGGFISESYKGIIPYVCGNSIVFSKNMCNFFIDNKEELNYVLPDDVSIGQFMQRNHIEPTFVNQVVTCYGYENCVRGNEAHYLFRCKWENVIDHYVLHTTSHIVELIYGK